MIKNIFSSQLRINMLSGPATTVVNIVVMAVGYPIYLHFLGYEKYGVWLVLTAILTFASLGNFGVGTAVMKLVSEEHGRGNIVGIQRCITTAIVMLLVSGLTILVILLIFRNPIVSTFKLDKENVQMVLWLMPYVGVLCIYSFLVQIYEAALSGLDRMDLANYIRSFSHAMQVVISGILLALGLGVKSMLIGNFASCAIIHLLTIICINKIIHLHFWSFRNINRIYAKNLFRFGGSIFFGSLISMLFNPFNKLILSRYAGVATLPIYDIAFSGSMHVRALVDAGLRALVPRISYLGARSERNESDKILRIYQRSMKLIYSFGVPIYGVLLLLLPFVLEVWLGDKFINSLTSTFQLMLIGTFLSLLGVPAYYCLMGIGRVIVLFLPHAIAAVVNIIMVLAIVLLTNTIQIRDIVLIVMLSFGLSTFYLIWQWRNTGFNK